MTPNASDDATALIESPTNTSVASAKFTMFNALPCELRLRVWNHASCIPQTVVITYSNPRSGVHGTLPQQAHFKGSHKTPALLHVCREAREVGQGVYAACHIGPADSNANNRTVYINPIVDEIRLHSSENSDTKALYWALTFQGWSNVGRFVDVTDRHLARPTINLLNFVWDNQDLYATFVPHEEHTPSNHDYYAKQGTIIIKAGTAHLGKVDRLALQLRPAMQSGDKAAVKAIFTHAREEHECNTNKTLEGMFFASRAVLPKNEVLQNLRNLETRSIQQDRLASTRGNPLVGFAARLLQLL